MFDKETDWILVNIKILWNKFAYGVKGFVVAVLTYSVAPKPASIVMVRQSGLSLCMAGSDWSNFSPLLIRKGKAIPIQAWTGPEGSRMLRLPDFQTIGTWKWQGCQPYAPAAFTPQEIHLALRQRLSRTQRHRVAEKIFFQWLDNPLGPRPPHCSRLHDHN